MNIYELTIEMTYGMQRKEAHTKTVHAVAEDMGTVVENFTRVDEEIIQIYKIGEVSA